MSSDPPSLSRREYVALVGAGVSALAGCSSGENTQTAEATATPTATGEDGSATATATGTETPGDPPEETATETPEPGDRAVLSEMETQLATVNFEGSWFDTHAHWQQGDSGFPDAYADAMEAHGVGATVLFSPSAQADREYESFLTTLTDPGVDYLPFMGAPPPGRRIAMELRDLYDGTEKAFWGIGEWKSQEESPAGMDESYWPRLWTLAADLDLPVMVHPLDAQEGTVEPAIANNPETTFLMHGDMFNYGRERAGLGPTLPRLLEEYDNLYWTADVVTMLQGAPYRFDGADAFVEWYESSADGYVRLYQNALPDLLDAAPNRVVWGTDVKDPWMTEDAVFGKFIDFSERVLENTATKHHDRYKYQNALDLFSL